MACCPPTRLGGTLIRIDQADLDALIRPLATVLDATGLPDSGPSEAITPPRGKTERARFWRLLARSRRRAGSPQASAAAVIGTGTVARNGQRIIPRNARNYSALCHGTQHRALAVRRLVIPDSRALSDPPPNASADRPQE